MDNKYVEFWNWFEQSKELFEKTEIGDDAIALLDQKINNLGDFAWEIGPGSIKPLFLTISPGGDRGLLDSTREIVSKAPNLSNWEFYYAKPIKEWDNYFDLKTEKETIGVDISNWEYILFRNENGSYDIQVKPNGIPPYLISNSDELYGIVEMVVESIIGEEKRLEKIEFLEVVDNFDNENRESKNSILHLRYHINTI